MSDPPWFTTVPESHQTSGSHKVSLHDALPPGTHLGEFELLGVLGSGAFGIVYLAVDHVLGRQVAIKEYMPAALAGRHDGTPIALRSPAYAPVFERGLDSFLSEARLLASFDHPALVKVHRFWRGNDTAYMAMQYVPGATLKDVRLAMSSPPGEAWLLALLEPLLDALELLHGQGVFHRDISPDNILILPGGRPVLLDFGAARRVIGTGSQFLSAVVKPPFAPVEQYASESEMRQGPWTDLYALGATLYFALLGRAPTASVVRAVEDGLPVLARRGDAALADMRGPLLETIDWMLAMAPGERPRDVESVRRALHGDIAVPPRPLQTTQRAEDERVCDHDAEGAPGDGAAADEGAAVSASTADGESREAATSSQGPPAAADDLPPPARSRRDARKAVVTLGLLGVAVFAGGAWTLNNAGPGSPALASLAAALRVPAGPAAPQPPVPLRAASPAPTALPGAPLAALSPTLPIATPSVYPVVAADPQHISIERSEVVQAAPVPLARDRAPATRPPRHGRAVARAWPPRAPEAAIRVPVVENVAARTRTAASRSPGACDGSTALSRMLCALRECKAPSVRAEAKCAKVRQTEQARQRRMERE